MKHIVYFRDGSRQVCEEATKSSVIQTTGGNFPILSAGEGLLRFQYEDGSLICYAIADVSKVVSWPDEVAAKIKEAEL